jgi:alkylhydroperoxidase family enzyme
MAEDFRSVDVCQISGPVLPPKVDFDPETAAIVARSGMSAFYGQFGHAPEVIGGWMAFYQSLVSGGRVELRTKELCRLRVAARNGCLLCLGGRFRDDDGVAVVSEDDVDAVIGGKLDDARFTAREQAALAWTETFRQDHSQVDAALMARTLEHFSEAEFVELAVSVAQFSGMGQLFAVLGIPSPVPTPA